MTRDRQYLPALAATVIGALVAKRSLDALRSRTKRRLVPRFMRRLRESIARTPLARIDETLHHCLGDIGRTFEIDRIGIVQGDRSRTQFIFTYRWSAPGVPSLPAVMRTRDLPIVTHRLRRGQTVQCDAQYPLPPHANIDRATLVGMGDRSLMLIPLGLEAPPGAGLWLSTYGRTVRWHTPIRHALAQATTVLASALRLRTAIQARADTESKTRIILDCLSAPVAVLDSRGAIVQTNRAWRTFGIGPAPGVSYVAAWRRAGEGNDAAREVWRRLDAALTAHQPGNIEYRYHAGDGDHTLEIDIAPINTAGGGAVVSQRDTTDRTRTELELQRRRTDAAHIARLGALGSLTASLAHELNQPLTAIRTNARTGQQYASTLPGEASELQSILVDIVADVERAGAIIERMRGFLQKRPLTVSALDLNDLVVTVVKLLASDALIRRTRIMHVLDTNLPPVQADRVQLQQVVLNLVLNALEAIDRSNSEPRRITLTTRLLDPSHAAISVHDTGPGLGPDPDQWFRAFHSTKEQGLGVGLSISRMIVEVHGGALLAVNNTTGGATFHIRLPIGGR